MSTTKSPEGTAWCDVSARVPTIQSQMIALAMGAHPRCGSRSAILSTHPQSRWWLDFLRGPLWNRLVVRSESRFLLSLACSGAHQLLPDFRILSFGFSPLFMSLTRQPFAYPGNHPSPYNGTWLGADKWFISDSPESEYRLTLTNSATGEVVPCYTATYQNYLKQAANSKWMVVHTRSGEGEDDGVVIIIERLDDVKVKPEDTRVTVRVPVLDCTSMVYFMQMSASDPDELMVIFEQNVDEMESYFVFVVVDVAKSHAKKDLEMVTMTTCSPPSFGSQVARQAMALRKKNGERCLVVKTIFGFDTMEIYYLEDGARRLQRLTTKVLYSQLDMTQLDESRFCLCTEKPGQIAEIWDCNDLTHPSEVIELSRDGSPGSTVHASRGLLVKCQGNCVEVIHAASARSLLTITVPCARLAVHAVSSV